MKLSNTKCYLFKIGNYAMHTFFIFFAFFVGTILDSNKAYAVFSQKYNTYNSTHHNRNYESHEKCEKYKKYEFVLFYNNSCNYCPVFCKTLKSYAAKHRIQVIAFKLTRESSYYFPNSIMVDQNTINQYFGERAKVAVPTLFILNPGNMHIYPVSRGNLTYTELTIRMNNLTRNIRQFEMREHE